MREQLKTIEHDLGQIADMLLLNGTLTECPGLVHGKMGIAVFFFHYAQYTDNMLYAEYAIDLIAEMQNQIHVSSSADYEKGLAGIGVGIEYLIQNKFLIVEDDICEDFDSRMFRAVMYDPWQDFSQYDGLSGYGRYWISRLRYASVSDKAKECLFRIIEYFEENSSYISPDEQYDVYCFLYDLHQIADFANTQLLTAQLEQCRKEWNLQKADMDQSFLRFGNSVIDNIVRRVQHNHYFNSDLQDDTQTLLQQIADLDMERVPVATGLLIGYAGEGMMRLTALDRTNMSWMLLL